MRHAALFGLVLMGACHIGELWPVDYLTQGTNRASQDEVVRELGPPYETHPLPDGGARWHYHQRRERAMVGAHGTIGGRGASECSEYILHFDRTGVLREWTQRDEPVCD